MQPQNPLDPQAPQQPTTPVPPTNPPVNPGVPAPTPAPAQQPVDPLAQPGQPTPQYAAPAPAAPAEPVMQQTAQPTPFTPADPMAPQPAPQQPVQNGMPMGAPAPMAPMPAGPEAPKGNFFANLNKKLLIKIGIIVGAVAIIGVGGFFILKALPSNPISNFVTGTASVSLEDYSSDAIGFSMKVPEGWSKDENTDGTFIKSVTFREPAAELDDKSDAGKYRASISVTFNDYSTSEFLKMESDEYFENAKDSMKRVLDSASDVDDAKTELISEQDIEVNGHKAYKVKMKATSNEEDTKGEVSYATFLYVFVSDQAQYSIITAVHEADKGVVDKVDEILGSFKSTK